MLKKLTKILSLAGVASVLASAGPGVNIARAEFDAINHANGSILQTGETQGEIRVISGDNKSWTKIKSGFGFVTFPVQLAAKSNPGGWALNQVWVVQGGALDVQNKSIYDSGSITGDTQHTHSGNLTGGALKLTPAERDQIVASCNAHLDPSTQQQAEHEEEAQIPLTLVMQSVQPGGGAVSEGLDWWEDTNTTNFPVKVVCEPFTRTIGGPSPEVQVDTGNSKIVQVELGLSANGNAVVGGTFTYSGSCPMGLNLNMRWVTDIGAKLKTYIKHKDVAGQHNWTSQTFEVTTNEPAYGGNWKKELTDMVSIPFAASTPVNGPGGANAFDLPNGGMAFNPGGGNGGGLNPATGFGATNTGTDGGTKRYVGFFRLVAYKSKKTVPAFEFGGGATNVTLYEGQKMSGWRKYDITCEPEQSTVALDSPKGLQNAPDTGTFNPDDAPAFPQPEPKADTTFDPVTRDLTIPPVHAPKPADNVVRANDDVPERIKRMAAEARRKQAAGKVVADPKRVSNAAIKARQMQLNADAARRAALAAQQARRKAAAQALARQRAAALAQQQAQIARQQAVAQALARRKLTRAPRRTNPGAASKSFLRAR